jgi:hypothetical protein
VARRLHEGSLTGGSRHSLRVDYDHQLGDETLAFQLFHRYAHRPENGKQLPDDITHEQLMTLLGEQGGHSPRGRARRLPSAVPERVRMTGHCQTPTRGSPS